MKKKLLTVILVFILPGAYAQERSDSIKTEKWSTHFQLTAIKQGHPSFNAAYSGNNSLSSSAEKGALSLTTTLFLGRQLWKGAALFFNPEIAGGNGISSTKGVAGFPNGETFRIGDPSPALYVARIYFQQIIALPNSGYEKAESGANQLGGYIPVSRITVSAGKFCIADFFDGNSYSHDPRTQFMNWALMSNGAWDYPANTRGYTSGIIVELVKPGWALRLAGAVVPKMANGPKMDWKIGKAHSQTMELEKNWKGDHPGAVRLLAFRNVSQAPTYGVTLGEIKTGDSTSVDVYTGNKEWKRYGGVKYGLGINAEQELSKTMGLFFRASLNDGKTATWAYTEIDKSISAGLNIKGTGWHRPDDELGIAGLLNGLSKDHRAFLSAGLYGFIIGDGKLNYGPESIAEVYYQAKLTSFLFASVDYQFIKNPGYNKDRGPAHVFGMRVHVEL